jgi:DNA-binding CsgD family transcriptional regulator
LAESHRLLVGRTEELALIEVALARVKERTPAVLLISGEPGIGKTRLLAELGRRGDERRYLVLTGRASELERDLPYWIFVDALDEYLHTVERPWIQALDEDSDGELSRIFPSLTSAVEPAATVLDERYRVHRAVRMLLEELAGAHPLVLLLDDLHWADPASIDLVGALVRRPPRASVLVAVAVRSRQAPSRLDAVVADADRAGLLIRLQPRALRETEVEEWLGPQVAAPVARKLYEESGGNPFYLEQLARASVLGDRVTTAPAALGLGPEADLPPTVAAALSSELAGLPVDARSLLDAAAVVGDPFELDFVAATGELGEPEALLALDPLLAAGLLERTDAPRRFRFRHPVLRRAVYDATPSAWRSAAHERAARALAAHGEPPAARAHHVDQFATLGDREAIRLFRLAADASAQRAPASAARWYGSALRLLPNDPADDDERAVLLEQLARARAGVGQFDEGRDALLELLAVAPPESARHVWAITACAHLEHLLGRHGEAHERLVTGLDELTSRTSPGAAILLLDLAIDAYFGRDYERVTEWGLQALAIAEALEDATFRAAAHAAVCLGEAYSDRIASAEAHRAEARALVDRLDDDQLAKRLDTLANLGAAEIYLDRYEDAEADLRRGLALGRRIGQGQLFPLLTQELGVALESTGRLSAAKEHLDGTVEAARLAGNLQSLAWALMNSAWTTMLTGDLDAALSLAEESAELVRGLEDSPLTIWSAVILGAVVIEAGRPADGVELIRAGAGGPTLDLVPGDFRAAIQERVTDALVALGRHGEADEAAALAERRADVTGLAMSRAHAARARAAVSLARGDAPDAVVHALGASAAASEIGARVVEARARVLAGRALHAAGEDARAVEELTAAATTLDACGAIRYRDEAERELRRLGKRDHRRRGTARARGDGVAALSARELEIARLVVDRKTNPEIAAELFLSQKTVETHLRNAFRKLDVSSRVELARAVESADRTS